MVQTLQQTAALNPGMHRIDWNSDGLAAGVYFVNVSINGRNNVQRVIVK
jgi:hypothetical protein